MARPGVEVVVLRERSPVWRIATTEQGELTLETSAEDGVLGRVGDTQPAESVLALVADLLGLTEQDVRRAAEVYIPTEGQ